MELVLRFGHFLARYESGMCAPVERLRAKRQVARGMRHEASGKRLSFAFLRLGLPLSVVVVVVMVCVVVVVVAFATVARPTRLRVLVRPTCG